ncbi:MAG: hypothetical protein IKP76_00640 [Bacilli bacterium]|nr:hypothetical protein [Bacilli bacterium]
MHQIENISDAKIKYSTDNSFHYDETARTYLEQLGGSVGISNTDQNSILVLLDQVSSDFDKIKNSYQMDQELTESIISIKNNIEDYIEVFKGYYNDINNYFDESQRDIIKNETETIMDWPTD